MLNLGIASSQAPTRRRELTKREESNLRMQLKSLLAINGPDDKHDANILLDAVIEKFRDGSKSVDSTVKEVSDRDISYALLQLLSRQSNKSLLSHTLQLKQMEMRVCDAEAAQRLGRCIIEFNRELDRKEHDKIGGNELFSAKSAADKHRRELQILRSGLQKGETSTRVAKYNKQCEEDKNKFSSGQVLETIEAKNDETAAAGSSSTTAEPMMTYQHAVHPFLGNPMECNGYPQSYVKNKPKNELNFFLTDESDSCFEQQDAGGKKKKRVSIFKKMSSRKLSGKEGKTNKHVEPESGLACSIISRENISFAQLKNQISSSPSEKKFKTKPVIIICHGFMSWRNQMLLVNLSSELLTFLDAHILRFDFSGNGHSKGEWRDSNFNREYEDLSAMIDFVTNSLGCQVGCVIGHSGGSASVLNYASHVAKQETENGKDAMASKCFVNLAGRYRVPGWDQLSRFGQEQKAEMLKNGFFDVYTEWGDDGRIFKVTNEHIGAYKFQNAADTAKVIVHLRRESSVRVLTIHGYEDEVVPVQDACRFDEEIANHNLYVIKQANHNFNGLKFVDEMVLQIVNHYNSVHKGT